MLAKDCKVNDQSLSELANNTLPSRGDMKYSLSPDEHRLKNNGFKDNKIGLYTTVKVST